MRLLLDLPSSPEAREIYDLEDGQGERQAAMLYSLLGLRLADMRVESLPSRGIQFRPARGASRAEFSPRPPERLVFSLRFPDLASLDEFARTANSLAGASIGADLPIAAMDSWCPPRDRPPLFHIRERALALVGAEALQAGGRPLMGEGVNIVMVDLGVNRAALSAIAPQAEFPGGWTVAQGGQAVRVASPLQAPARGHGTMVASAVLSLAPRARIFDFPLLPDALTEVVAWTSWAHAALQTIKADIEGGLAMDYPGPWVFCHAWGVYDRRMEQALPASVASYTGNRDHVLNALIRALDAGGHDQVFAAGNGGQFSPHPRCGPEDTGPGRSIFGAACMPEVLTVGAVRADGTWIGYSSQGPGQPGFAAQPGAMVAKPDICAPSHFVDHADAGLLWSGTSAACGLVAGAAAALRGCGSPLAGLSTAALRQHLRQTARKPEGVAGGYDNRHGHGILDLRQALAV